MRTLNFRSQFVMRVVMSKSVQSVKNRSAADSKRRHIEQRGLRQCMKFTILPVGRIGGDVQVGPVGEEQVSSGQQTAQETC